MSDVELQNFRKTFCEKSASLGVKPSELLLYVKYANASQTKKSAINWLSVGKWLQESAAWAALAAITGGASLGGLAAYGLHNAQRAVDPSGDLLGDEADPLSENLKMQLIAKYRNATEQAEQLKEDAI